MQLFLDWQHVVVNQMKIKYRLKRRQKRAVKKFTGKFSTTLGGLTPHVNGKY
jgi:hypothetical protein